MKAVLCACLLVAAATAAPLLAVIDVAAFGPLTIQLRPDAAPKTVANFVHLAESGYYRNRTFYRLVHNFVLQGGSLYGAPKTVPLEYKLPNAKFSVGLARAEAPDTGSSEFYINIGNNTQTLMPGGVTKDGYCVFAEVVAGFDSLERMAVLPTHVVQGMNAPLKPPVITDITVKGQ